MEKHCGNCRYFHQLKELIDHSWHYGTVCTVLPENERGYDAFALVVSAGGVCELWVAREDA